MNFISLPQEGNEAFLLNCSEAMCAQINFSDASQWLIKKKMLQIRVMGAALDSVISANILHFEEGN